MFSSKEMSKEKGQMILWGNQKKEQGKPNPEKKIRKWEI